jgi:hypothetical protein
MKGGPFNEVWAESFKEGHALNVEDLLSLKRGVPSVSAAIQTVADIRKAPASRSLAAGKHRA